MSRAWRRAFLLFSVFGAMTSLVVASAPAATSAAATAAAGTAVRQVAVIPQDAAPATIDDDIGMAGATGFLHRYNFGSQYLWTDYATGRTVPVPALAGSIGVRPAGGDRVAAVNGNTITETDLASMATQRWTMPAGYSALGVSGNSVLALGKSGTGNGSALYLLNFASAGADTVTQVTGLPAGATLFTNQVTIVDAAAMIVRYGVSGTTRYGLLALATAAVTPIPATAGAPVALSANWVGVYDATSGAVRVYSRAGLLDGTDNTATTVTLPGVSGGYEMAFAGDHVIAVPRTAECAYCGYTVKPALDVPLSGAAAVEALPEAQTGTGALAQGPDGAALAVGGTGAADWSVHQLTAGAGGQLNDSALLHLTGPMANAGLTISQGLVRHVEAQPVPGGTPAYLLFNHLIVPDGGQFAGSSPHVAGGRLPAALPCAASASCLRTADGNGYGTSFLAADTATSVNLREVIDANTSSMTLSLGSAGGTIADAGLSYVIVNGVSPARQYLVDVGHRQVSTGPVTGAALWFDTLWRSDGRGRLRASNLDTSTSATPVATRANCTASEIQATQRWIYWSCGTNGPAGVYDLRTRAEITVPAGPMLLGDGYLVHRDPSTGDLVSYDVHADSVAAPVTLATGVPAAPAGSGAAPTDSRNITWAVDKYSGDVAYVAPDDSVHVLSAGVPATPAALTFPPGAWLSNGSVYFGKNGAWTQNVLLSRPVTSWTLTVRAAGTSHVVHTQSGGGARIGFWVTWNGRLGNGTKAYSGRYTWSLTVHSADSATATTVPGSTLTVFCGQIPYRSYDCDGAPGLLADLGGTAGESHWYEGHAFNGKLRDNGYTENWPLCSYTYCVSAIVPFGDISGDGYADVLVRYRTGKLVAYLGIGQGDYNPDGGKKPVSLGTGWNAYRTLAYPGDLTSDGKPDLVGRDTAGRLWLFAGNGKGGFKKRVRIGGSWGGYPRLSGGGDLTGDGTGDLLAVDKAGVMWLFPGNGHGGFKKRVRVSSGWSKYNAVIGIGDLSGRGCDDLVARDRNGTMWRFDGNCKGGFAAPVKIGTGWSKYKGLF